MWFFVVVDDVVGHFFLKQALKTQPNVLFIALALTSNSQLYETIFFELDILLLAVCSVAHSMYIISTKIRRKLCGDIAGISSFQHSTFDNDWLSYITLSIKYLLINHSNSFSFSLSSARKEETEQPFATTAVYFDCSVFASG